MTYAVELTSAARRNLYRLPETAAMACSAFLAGPLAENPHRVGKPLQKQLSGLHSARRGEYRVIYRIDDGRIVVVVITIRHRRDAYH